MTLDELLRNRKLYQAGTPWLTPYPKASCPQCRADVTLSAVIVCSRHCEHCGTRVIDPDPEGDEPTPEEVIALPTVQEYLAEVKPYRRVTRWGGRLLAFVFVLGFFMIPVILTNLPGGAPEWVAAVMFGWICMGIPLVAVCGFAMITIRSAWNPMLACPHCKEADLDASQYIISSRCCVKCGVRQVLDNPVTKESPQPLYSLPSVIAHRKNHERIQRIKYHINTWILVAFVLGPIFIASYANINIPLIIGSALAVCMTVQLVYTVYVKLIHILYCSSCHSHLRNYGIKIATKHCYHCGERVIAEPEPLPPEIEHDAG